MYLRITSVIQSQVPNYEYIIFTHCYQVMVHLPYPHWYLHQQHSNMTDLDSLHGKRIFRWNNIQRRVNIVFFSSSCPSSITKVIWHTDHRNDFSDLEYPYLYSIFILDVSLGLWCYNFQLRGTLISRMNSAIFETLKKWILHHISFFAPFLLPDATIMKIIKIT